MSPLGAIVKKIVDTRAIFCTPRVFDFGNHNILYEKLIPLISEDRCGTYLKAAGFDKDRALEIYHWNMRLSSSFYPLLATIEVCLRNLIGPRITVVYGRKWWLNSDFHLLLGSRGKGIVLRAAKEIENRGKEVTHGRMTAELSFGFWTNMLLEKYEILLWTPVRSQFQNLPTGATRSDLFELSNEIRDLRNRISHHEPIFRRDISEDYAKAIRLLEWLGPAKAEWIRPKLEVMKILRERP